MVKVITNKAEYDNLIANTKSVFVDFYADWCGPCKMVGPLVEKISESNPEITFVKVNVDEHPEIAQMYGIMSIPTLITFKDGKLANQALGFMPEDELQNLANTAK